MPTLQVKPISPLLKDKDARKLVATATTVKPPAPETPPPDAAPSPPITEVRRAPAESADSELAALRKQMSDMQAKHNEFADSVASTLKMLQASHAATNPAALQVPVTAELSNAAPGGDATKAPTTGAPTGEGPDPAQLLDEALSKTPSAT